MSTSSTPRASSHSRNSKRSTTNLANLRLAPLSTRFTEEAPLPRSAPRSPYNEAAELVYARHHPTYLQGRSAPSTPGILSRSSSRRHLGGGLSRRGSLYDDAPEYPVKDAPERVAGRVDGTVLQKASSEATLFNPSRLSGPGLPLRRRHGLPPRSKTGGSTTPRAVQKSKSRRQSNEDWLSHASATTNALLQESKGQTWLSSHNSAVSLAVASSSEDDGDEDEGYEELAAMSANPLPLLSSEQRHAHNQHKWGSRFGSRSASRRTSRRGSFSRTPGSELGTPMDSYFNTSSPVLPSSTSIMEEGSSTSDDAHEEMDESELAALARNQSMGFSGIVDTIMSFSIFGTAETSEESGGETAVEREEQQARRVRIQAPQPAAPKKVVKGEEQKVGIWEDAKWLAGVAGRALR